MTSTSTGLVLVADSFEEETAIACVRALRDAGMAVTLVGLKAGPVTGSRGITVQADLSLEQVAATHCAVAGTRLLLVQNWVS